MEIDKTLQNVRIQIATSLSKECENQNGSWVNVPWVDTDANGTHDQNGDSLNIKFYTVTGANTLWGYCKNSN